MASALLFAFSLAFLLPLLWTLRSALLPEGLAYALPPVLGPLTLENFRQVLEGPLGRGFRNSLVVASLVVLLGLPLAAGLGYALARYRLGGHPLRFAVLATQMLPPIVLALPLFALLRTLGLSGSLMALVLSHLAFALPFMAWLLMGFFQSFPREVEEAAHVDGATPLTTFFHVVLPLSVPGLFASGVMGFLFSWNEFLFSLLLSGRETQTIPVALSALVTQRGVLFAQVAAGVVLSVVPVALLARTVDRYLVEGLTLGAVK
ncbi:carbohydrate ABC transporter permease [Thermus islandicus]|uniref:carbohydrate ABC transporter permease n=1 Tax=Thermus islandicus TaxID=540988 RepID=UPI0003B55835|nr:carbohydrate ABC transporter permease [Thermus islandicus]